MASGAYVAADLPDDYVAPRQSPSEVLVAAKETAWEHSTRVGCFALLVLYLQLVLREEHRPSPMESTVYGMVSVLIVIAILLAKRYKDGDEDLVPYTASAQER